MANTAVKTLKNYINGEWVESRSGKTEDVYNPATGEVIARVPISSTEEVDELPERQKLPLKHGKGSLFPKPAFVQISQLLVDHWDELSPNDYRENGKNLKEAKAKCSGH